jgi:allantoin racemase
MRVRVVVPLTGTQFNDVILDEAEAAVAEETQVELVNIDEGSESIESCTDEVVVGPDILRKVRDAAEDGVDGVFITCFGDPAVPAARELVDIPVTGGFEPAVLLAMGLGDQFSIVTVLPNVVPLIRGLARRLGIADRLASVRVIDTPVLELEDHAALEAKLHEAMRLAVLEDDAHVLVLGCTGMLGVAASLQRALAAEGLGVPVVDPTKAALGWLELQHRMGVRHSRRTYMPPPPKVRAL